MQKREKIVYDKCIDNGWEVLTKGWPDFLLYKEDQNEAIFIEVKSKATKYEKKHNHPMGGIPTKEQARMHKILGNLGLTVKVVHIE